MTTSIIVGIDPGLRNIGAAALMRDGQKWRCIDARCFALPLRKCRDQEETLCLQVTAVRGWLAALARKAPLRLTIEGQMRARQGNRQRGRSNAGAEYSGEAARAIWGLGLCLADSIYLVEPQARLSAIGLSPALKSEPGKFAVQARIPLIVSGWPELSKGEIEHVADGAAIAIAGGLL